MEWLAGWLLAEGASFVFTEIIGTLAKGAIEDYVKDSFKDIIKSGTNKFQKNALENAAGQAIVEFLTLIRNELEFADLDQAEQKKYEQHLKKFIHHKDVKAALGAVFAPSAKAPDAKMLENTWQKLNLKPLPDDFDWRRISKPYKNKVAQIVSDSLELKDLLIARNSVQELNNTEVSPDFDLEKYAQNLQDFYGYLRLDSLYMSADEYRMRLWRMFIPQTMRESRPVLDIPKELYRQLQASGQIDSKESLEDADLLKEAYFNCPTRSVLEYIADRKCLQAVVTGDPGSGKSTLVQYIALDWVEHRLEADNKRPIPILIELRKYAQDPNHPNNFLEYLHCGANTKGCLDRHKLHECLESGKAFVMFDGLDEVFDPKLRDTIVTQIIRFSNDYPLVRILVTSRKIGYQSEPFRHAQFREFTIEDLDDEQIAEFCDRWHRLAFNIESERLECQAKLTKAIAESPAIRELSGNPLLLTMMAILNRHRELPRIRYKLYECASELLLLNWDFKRQLIDANLSPDTIGTSEKQAMLRKVAHYLQSSPKGLAGNLIAGKTLAEILIAYLQGLGIDKPRQIANRIINQLHERNFILCLYGGETYGFVHRTFLEFFCAAEFVDRLNEKHEITIQELCETVLAAHWQDETWHEVLRLIAGRLSEKFVAEMIRYLMNISIDRQFHRDDLQRLKRSGIENILFATELLNEVHNRLPIIDTANDLLETIKALSQENLHINSALALANAVNTVWQNDKAVSDWMKLVPAGLIDFDAPDELKSEKGVDYQKLRDLLRSAEWEAADKETNRVMCEASGRQKEGWLKKENIDTFPCADLLTIDRLWVKYSGGKFGFSVQKQIWLSVGGNPDAQYDIYKIFSDRVGWYEPVKENFLMPSQVYQQKNSFSFQGNFPFFINRECLVNWLFVEGDYGGSLLWRRDL
jgi:predicted NACHT family NTPase